TGAVIARARVQIQRLEDRSIRNTNTDDSGRFSFAALPPGRYRVQVESTGFRTSVRMLSLLARDRGVLSAKLEVGSFSETVEVQRAAAAIDAVMAPKEIQSFTVNGQNIAQLALVQDAKKSNGNAKAQGESRAPGGHVRSYFPEALYINPR